MTITTDFLFAEAPVGRGAGGNSPRRLIPSCFQRTAAVGARERRTGSLIRIVVVLAVSLAAGVGASLVVDRPADRSVVIAPLHLPAPSEPGDLFE